MRKNEATHPRPPRLQCNREGIIRGCFLAGKSVGRRRRQNRPWAGRNSRQKVVDPADQKWSRINSEHQRIARYLSPSDFGRSWRLFVIYVGTTPANRRARGTYPLCHQEPSFKKENLFGTKKNATFDKMSRRWAIFRPPDFWRASQLRALDLTVP